MSRILVPLDESPLAEGALGWAALLARLLGSVVHLVSVYRSDEEFWDYAELDPRGILRAPYETLPSYLEAVAAGETVHGLKVTTEVRTGDIAREILAAADEGDTRLIVITTRGRGGFRPGGYGSVTDKLVRSAAVPVLVVPPDGPPPLVEGITVALDGSRQAEAALTEARRLAGVSGARLHLLRVVDPAVDWRILDESYEAFLEHLAQRADAYLRGTASSGEVVAVVRGTAADAMLRYAEAHQCQLLAIAAHGRDGSIRLGLGSTADAVLRAADRPILLVRSAEDMVQPSPR